MTVTWRAAAAARVRSATPGNARRLRRLAAVTVIKRGLGQPEEAPGGGVEWRRQRQGVPGCGSQERQV
ncbi:MAG: hypothetical protein ACP5MJ_11660 [Roseiflexus sp.]